MIAGEVFEKLLRNYNAALYQLHSVGIHFIECAHEGVSEHAV